MLITNFLDRLDFNNDFPEANKVGNISLS